MKIKTVFLGVILILLTLTGCENKQERCDQVAFSMKKYGFIRHGMYQAGNVQRMCLQEWDTKGNDKWRDCILTATSKAAMNECGWPEFKPDKFQ